MLMGLVPIFAIALAIVAVVKNRNSDINYSRKPFTILFLLVSAPIMVLVFYDLYNLFGEAIELPIENPAQALFLYMLVVAYPYYQRVRWRISDAGYGIKTTILTFIPFLNFFVFLFLCLSPTKERVLGAYNN